MSTTHSTTKHAYSHLSAFERGQIKAYLEKKTPLAEIARRLNRHRSAIFREIKRRAVPQLEEKNGKQVYKLVYFPDAGQRVYEKNRENCRYLKLEHCSKAFIQELERALKEKPRCHSVDSFVFLLFLTISSTMCSFYLVSVRRATISLFLPLPATSR